MTGQTSGQKEWPWPVSVCSGEASKYTFPDPLSGLSSKQGFRFCMFTLHFI